MDRKNTGFQKWMPKKEEYMCWGVADRDDPESEFRLTVNTWNHSQAESKVRERIQEEGSFYPEVRCMPLRICRMKRKELKTLMHHVGM